MQKKHEKIQHQFMIKMLSKLGIEKNFPQFDKEYLQKKSTANIIHNGEKLETFPLRKRH